MVQRIQVVASENVQQVRPSVPSSNSTPFPLPNASHIPAPQRPAPPLTSTTRPPPPIPQQHSTENQQTSSFCVVQNQYQQSMPCATPSYPSPAPNTFVLYSLHFCPPLTSVCFGCRNPLKPCGIISEWYNQTCKGSGCVTGRGLESRRLYIFIA